MLPGVAATFARIHEAVAAHPHGVVRLRQIGHQESPGVVGDDDLREGRRKVARFGDDPDAGFRAARAGDEAGDVVVVYLDLWLEGFASLKACAAYVVVSAANAALGESSERTASARDTTP